MKQDEYSITRTTLKHRSNRETAHNHHLSRIVTKPTKWHVCPAKTQISLVICPVWSEFSLSDWRKLGSLATHWAHCEDSDQNERMPRLIWVFAERTCLFVGFDWRTLGSLATYWAHSEDSDQTVRMPRLIWVFAGRTCHFVGFVMRRIIYKFHSLICSYDADSKMQVVIHQWFDWKRILDINMKINFAQWQIDWESFKKRRDALDS